MIPPVQTVEGPPVTAGGSVPPPPPAAPESGWKSLVAWLKDTKEVLAGIAALATAATLAITYFATSKSLECFKAETKRNEERIQVIFQVNDLTLSWQQANELLEAADAKRKKSGGPSSKEFMELRARAEEAAARLGKARDRRAELDRPEKSC